MTEQSGETNCIHGVGHKEGIHGCDGCCSKGAESSDTWPEIVKVLDKYSMEAWRSGVVFERERIIKLLLGTPQGMDAMLEAFDNHDEGEAIIALINGNYKWCYCVGTWRCPNHESLKVEKNE